MTSPRWTIAVGCVSCLVVLYFWMTMFLASGWIRQRPGDLSPLLIGICLSVVLSVPAAVKGAKWWYTSTALNAGTPIWGHVAIPLTGLPRHRYDAATYKFTGKERDSESGLDYFGARHYAGLGRFTLPD
jgi:hypothetical protein